MRKKQTQIRKYATVITIFLTAVVIGLLVFFYGIQRSVEKRSQKTMMNNVSRQSEHLKSILNLQYQYLDGIAEEIGQSGQLLSKKNTGEKQRKKIQWKTTKSETFPWQLQGIRKLNG